jgi:2-polyprenyl-3-methyl-5-hydroxy-6-metoxy-1,4-benzoquinol methylase
MKCVICKGAELTVFYKGPIRKGKFPNVTEDGIIYQCPSCQTQMFEGPDLNYETEEYRELVDTRSTAVDYYKIHDHEQPSRLEFFNLADLRGATCIDVGSGAGSFLDLIKGYARETVAIEPARYYHAELECKGHIVFSYGKDALAKYRAKADLVTCFSVMEHIPDPVVFMKELAELCQPGGTIIISTPNSDDWLIDFLPSYKAFFYRVVHKWYFNAASLKFLCEKTGLGNIAIQYKQRFPIANALNWIRDNRPSGNAAFFFSDIFEGFYKEELKQKGKADYIYLIIKK